MYEQHFYAEGAFLGSVVRPSVIVHGELQSPYSYAYFCPDCGEVWARCRAREIGKFHSAKWQVQGGYCRKHPERSNPFSVAGSLMLAWEPEYCELLLSCPDVVKWEFDRHMEFIERKIAND